MTDDIGTNGTFFPRGDFPVVEAEHVGGLAAAALAAVPPAAADTDGLMSQEDFSKLADIGDATATEGGLLTDAMAAALDGAQSAQDVADAANAVRLGSRRGYASCAAVRIATDYTLNTRIEVPVSGVMTPFDWDGASTTADTAAETTPAIQITGVTTGRFLRVEAYAAGQISSAIAAIPDATTSVRGMCTTAQAAAIDATNVVPYYPLGTGADDWGPLSTLMATLDRSYTVRLMPGTHYASNCIVIGENSPNLLADANVLIVVSRDQNHPQPSSTAFFSDASAPTLATTTFTVAGCPGDLVIRADTISTIVVGSWIVVGDNSPSAPLWSMHKILKVAANGADWDLTLDTALMDHYPIGSSVRLLTGTVPQGWVFDGGGCKVRGTASRFVSMPRTDGLTIKSLTYIDSDNGDAIGHVVAFDNSSRTFLAENIRYEGSAAYAYIVTSEIDSRGTIRRCGGGNSIICVDGSDMLIEHCDVMYMTAGTSGQNNRGLRNTIRDCTMQSLELTSGSGQSEAVVLDNFRVENCHFRGRVPSTSGTAMQKWISGASIQILCSSRNLVISGCDFELANRRGCAVYFADNATHANLTATNCDLRMKDPTGIHYGDQAQFFLSNTAGTVTADIHLEKCYLDGVSIGQIGPGISLYDKDSVCNVVGKSASSWCLWVQGVLNNTVRRIHLSGTQLLADAASNCVYVANVYEKPVVEMEGVNTSGYLKATNGVMTLRLSGKNVVGANGIIEEGTGKVQKSGGTLTLAGTGNAQTYAFADLNANDGVEVSRATVAGTPGLVTVACSDGVGVVITGAASDTSVINVRIVPGGPRNVVIQATG